MYNYCWVLSYWKCHLQSISLLALHQGNWHTVWFRHFLFFWILFFSLLAIDKFLVYFIEIVISEFRNVEYHRDSLCVFRVDSHLQEPNLCVGIFSFQQWTNVMGKKIETNEEKKKKYTHNLFKLTIWWFMMRTRRGQESVFPPHTQPNSRWLMHDAKQSTFPSFRTQIDMR